MIMEIVEISLVVYRIQVLSQSGDGGWCVKFVQFMIVLLQVDSNNNNKTFLHYLYCAFYNLSLLFFCCLLFHWYGFEHKV